MTTQKSSRKPHLKTPLSWLLAPASFTEQMAAPFTGRYIAHRGLHTKDKTVPENSMAAFSAAADAGYGMEFDIQLSRDGQVVVFHDDDLKRVCQTEGLVISYDYEQLKTFPLCGTDEHIPLFTDVLALIDGRVPLVIELKPQGKRNAELCEKALEILSGYSGPYCVESFDPRIVHWFRRHAPGILRGQLAGPLSSYKSGTPVPIAWAFSRCLFNFYARPHFIAYKLTEKPFTVKKCEKMGAMKVCWTSRKDKHTAGNDTVIFEYYRPAVRFGKQ